MRTAVVSVLVIDDFGSSGIAFGQFQRPFDRFAARIDEINRVERIGQQRCDALCVAYLRRFDRFAVDHQVQVVLRLRADRVDYLPVAVPYGADRDAGDQVDPPFPVSPVQVDSFGALHFEHHRVIGCLSDVFEEQLSEICRHVRMILPAKIRKSSARRFAPGQSVRRDAFPDVFVEKAPDVEFGTYFDRVQRLIGLHSSVHSDSPANSFV